MLHLLLLAVLAAPILSEDGEEPYKAKHSLKCETDEDFDPMKQEFQYTMPKFDTEDEKMRELGLSFWDQFQWTFYFFGQFVGDEKNSKVTVDYMTEDDDTVVAAEIDCGAKKWTTWYTDKTLGRVVWQDGVLNSSLIKCQDGELFDVILKVTQRRLLFFQFNGQLLHDGEVVWKTKAVGDKYIVGQGQTYVDVLVPKHPLPLTSEYYAYQAVKISYKSTGAAFLERFAFGQCTAWPKQNTCAENVGWTYARSKGNSTQTLGQDTEYPRLERFLTDVAGQGIFGNNHFNYVSGRCLSEKLYSWMNTMVHPDRDLPMNMRSNRYYCCCTDMRTGGVYKDDPATYCYSRPTCFMNQISCFTSLEQGLLEEAMEEALENDDVKTVFAGLL